MRNKNSNNNKDSVIIECPECHTKFSIKLSNDVPDKLQFHCSKCDNLFSVRKEDLDFENNEKQPAKKSFFRSRRKKHEEDTNEDTEFTLGDAETDNEEQEEYEVQDEDYENSDAVEEEQEEEYEEEDEEGQDEEDEEGEDEEDEEGEEEYEEGEEDEEYEEGEEEEGEYEDEEQEEYEEEEQEEYAVDAQDDTNESQEEFVLDDSKKSSKNKKSLFSKFTNSDASDDHFFDDVKDVPETKYPRKSAFLKSRSSTAKINVDNVRSQLKTSSYSDNNSKNANDLEIESWLNSNSNDFNNKNSAFNDYSSQDDFDLLSTPNKMLQNDDTLKNSSYEFKNKKTKNPNAFNIQRKVRSWQAVYKLSLPFLLFLIILTFTGFYLQTDKELFEKLDLSIFKTGKIAPAGLFLKKVRLSSVTLNNGENIKIVTGKVINDSDNVIDDVLLECVLFDENDNEIISKKVKANSQLGSFKTSELLPQTSDVIEKFQNAKMQKKQRLAPGEQVRFAIAFTDPKKFQNVAKYIARIYSVN